MEMSFVTIKARIAQDENDERRRFAMLQRWVNLQAAWHARFDHQSIEAVTGAPPASVQDA